MMRSALPQGADEVLAQRRILLDRITSWEPAIDAKKTLAALEFFARGASREQILQELVGKDIDLTNEILIRWAWCKAQKRAILEGRTFNRPYLCEVGPRKRRQNIDREFYALLTFLPRYNQLEGTNYLLLEYRGDSQPSPDYSVQEKEASNETILGIEITEAPLTSDSSKEEKIWEKILAELKTEFSAAQGTLTIWLRNRPPSDLARDLTDVKRWIHAVVEGSVFPQWNGRFLNCALGLSIAFEKTDEPFLICDVSGDGTGKFSNQVEELIARSVVAAIESKLNGPTPAIQPCILAIYDNTDLPVPDYNEVATLVATAMGGVAHKMFRQVWLFRSDKQQRVL